MRPSEGNQAVHEPCIGAYEAVNARRGALDAPPMASLISRRELVSQPLGVAGVLSVH